MFTNFEALRPPQSLPLPPEPPLEGPSALKYRACQQNQASRELASWLSRFRRNGLWSAGRTLPATRAGGQDDVSLYKLPQIEEPSDKIRKVSIQEEKGLCLKLPMNCPWSLIVVYLKLFPLGKV